MTANIGRVMWEWRRKSDWLPHHRVTSSLMSSFPWRIHSLTLFVCITCQLIIQHIVPNPHIPDSALNSLKNNPPCMHIYKHFIQGHHRNNTRLFVTANFYFVFFFRQKLLITRPVTVLCWLAFATGEIPSSVCSNASSTVNIYIYIYGYVYNFGFPLQRIECDTKKKIEFKMKIDFCVWLLTWTKGRATCQMGILRRLCDIEKSKTNAAQL